MLRTVLKRFESELVSHSGRNILDSALGQTTVRWRRKPRWLPVAKSKMFRVPQKPQIPKEEYEELKRLHNVYKTEMKSIRLFLIEKLKESTTGEEFVAEQKRLEEEEKSKCFRLNEEWNASVAKLREEALAKDKEEAMEEIMKALEKNRIDSEEERQKADQLVREEKERSKSYITMSNIDAAIEKALQTTVDYNFGIDLDFNVYHGRLARPEPTPPKSSELDKQVATNT